MRKLFLLIYIASIYILICVTSCSHNDNISDDKAICLNYIDINKDTIFLSDSTTNSIEFKLHSTKQNLNVKTDSTQTGIDILSTTEGDISTTLYKLQNIEIMLDRDGTTLYRAYIKDLGLSNNYNEDAILRVRCVDEDNNEYTLEKKFHVKYCVETGLPILYIETPEKQIIQSKTEWIKNAEYKLIAPHDAVLSTGKLSIKGRGNSSWNFPKKSYSLKFSEKVELLGMPQNKRWVLLANWMDRTLLRNTVSFEIARKTNIDWIPRGQFVDVVLNEERVGNYFICEQIRVDNNRVNVSELSKNDIDDEIITGGYLLELDTNFDEKIKFKSAIYQLPYMIKSPDEDNCNDKQIDYIYNYIAEFEKCLSDSVRIMRGDYREYIDVESFIDYWIVNELAENNEPGHPKSFYMYKERGQKLKAGPVWDFDWKTYVLWKTNDFSCMKAIYYQRLFIDPLFVAKVKQRWDEIKPELQTIPDYIRKEAELIRLSEAKNHRLWPINIVDWQVNEDFDLTFDQSVTRLMNSFILKMHWLDEYLNKRNI